MFNYNRYEIRKKQKAHQHKLGITKIKDNYTYKQPKINTVVAIPGYKTLILSIQTCLIINTK